MGSYLVVAHQTAASNELIDGLIAKAAADPEARFTLLVPATPAHELFHPREGEGRDIAGFAAKEAKGVLREAGIKIIRTDVGDESPLVAIENELRDKPDYDGIIICTFPVGMSKWLKLDLVHQAERRFPLPISHIVAQSVVEEPIIGN